MRLLWITGLLLLPFSLFCKDEYKYGKVTPEEVSQKFYPKDSSAGAIIIYNIGDFDASERTIYTKREKIKFYDKNSLQMANQVLVLYHDKYSPRGVSVDDIRGKTYNFENGNIITTDLPKSAVRIDQLDDYHNIVHFAFSNVREGSVIEYEIKLNVPGIGIPDWYFQQPYPVLYSQFTVTMPEFFHFRRNTKGYLSIPPAIEEVRNTADNRYVMNISKWQMWNIPAFLYEPFISCADNYISQIDHELLEVKIPPMGYYGLVDYSYTTNWNEVIKKLLLSPYHGELIDGNVSFFSDDYERVRNIKDNTERMTACYKEIQKRMSWNGGGSIFSASPKVAYKEMTGNSADINFLLIKLLKGCNIEAYPVLLSTRDNGFMPRFPSFDKFNYLIVLAKVDGKSILLDATGKYLSPGMLPPRCLNDKGLVIKAGNIPEWIDLTPKQNAGIVNSVEFKLNEDGSVQGKSTFKRSGYAALEVRKDLTGGGNRADSILKRAAQGVQISNYIALNKDSVNTPVIESFDFSLKQDETAQAGSIMLEPILFEQMPENPFKTPERTYPVEFETPVDKTYIVNISLPANIELEEQPKSVALSLPDNSAKFTYQLNAVNNSLQLSAKFTIKNTLYSQDQYPLLREFYAQAIAKMNEPLLLHKKN